MLLMLRLLMIGSLLISSAFALSFDKKVVNFDKQRINSNARVKVEKISVFSKKKLKNGWYGYVLNIDAKINKKEVHAKDTLFTNGKLIAPELFDINNGSSLKAFLTPSLTKAYYNSKHLIYGNKNAKNKIVVFSDPLCPFCKDFMPKVFAYVKKHKKDIALYYYDYPLLLVHPASKVLSLAMKVAKIEGVKDLEKRVYATDFEKYFSIRETKPKKILAGFNKVFGTNITVAQIKDKKIIKDLKNDVKAGDAMMVQGTPTIFVNGIKDISRTKWNHLK